MSAFELLNRKIQEFIYDDNWSSLRPFQVESIEEIMKNDSSIVISAATASGKTEAAFLPILSKVLNSPKKSIQVLYVGPLKALINDQFRRIENICNNTNIVVNRWHGDVSSNVKKKLRENPEGILLITPESLESNFINYGNMISKIYKDLEFIVIDELHSFLGNVRGIHLRSLISRLELTIGKKVRVIGLSATLGDYNVAKRYISYDNLQNVKLIISNNENDIKYRIKSCMNLLTMKNEKEELEIDSIVSWLFGISDFIQTNNFEVPKITLNKDKIDEIDSPFDIIADEIYKYFQEKTHLIFFDSKYNLEIISDKLNQICKRERISKNPFLLHHGSLSKEIREDSEEKLKNKNENVTAMCTSTLEMGIDIGDVKSVGQINPPWSVSSLKQRLGRSGRSESEPSIMHIFVIDSFSAINCKITDYLFPQLIRSIALTRLLLKKWLEPENINKLNFSTLIHQILSCLKEKSGIKAIDLFEILIEKGAFRNITSEQFMSLLKELGKKDLIEQISNGDLILGVFGEKIVLAPDFYAAFKTPSEYNVLEKNYQIGTINALFPLKKEDCILLAGKRWIIDDIIDESKVILVKKYYGNSAPKFIGEGGFIHTKIIKEMYKVFMDNDLPPYLDLSSINLLKNARKMFREFNLDETNILIQNDEILWFPWVGDQTMLTLLAYAESDEIEVSGDRLSIKYKKIEIERFKTHLENVIEDKFSDSSLVASLNNKYFEKFDEFVSEELLDYAVIQDVFKKEEAQTVVKLALDFLINF